jgi:predicted nucleic acid-binding protein
MAVLIDTNILARSVQPHHPHAPAAESAIAALTVQREAMVIAVQNIVEFWAVATRPQAHNGLGLSTDAAWREIARFKSLFGLLPETNGVFFEWERLVREYRVSGKNAHDARLVAAMIVNGVDRILTFNTADFSRFSEIQVLDPQSFA